MTRLLPLLLLLNSCAIRRLTLNPPVLPQDAKIHSCWEGQRLGVIHCNYTSGGSDLFKTATMPYFQAVKLLNDKLDGAATCITGSYTGDTACFDAKGKPVSYTLGSNGGNCQSSDNNRQSPMLRRNNNGLIAFSSFPDRTTAEIMVGDYDISLDGGRRWFHLFGPDCLKDLPKLIINLPVKSGDRL